MNPVNRVQAALDKISGKDSQPIPIEGRPPVMGVVIDGMQVCTAGPRQESREVDTVVLRVSITGLPAPAICVWEGRDIAGLKEFIADLQAALAQVEANR